MATFIQIVGAGVVISIFLFGLYKLLTPRNPACTPESETSSSAKEAEE